MEGKEQIVSECEAYRLIEMLRNKKMRIEKHCMSDIVEICMCYSYYNKLKKALEPILIHNVVGCSAIDSLMGISVYMGINDRFGYYLKLKNGLIVNGNGSTIGTWLKSDTF